MKKLVKQSSSILVLISLIIFLFEYKAIANIEKGWELELYGGTMKTDMGEIFAAPYNHRIETESEDGGTFGLRLGYNFNSILGLEWNAAFSTARYESKLFDNDLSAVDPISEDETTGLFLTDLNLVVHLLDGPIVPFLTGGGGIIGTVDQTPFAYNYGGGVKIFLSEKIAIRIDYREYFADYEDDLEEVVDIAPGPIYYEYPFSYNEDFHLREVSIGLTIAF
jgi:opacity protein-like surface antigen